MRIDVNGEPAEMGEEATVAEVVASRAGDARRVAVAVDGEVVPRSAWASTPLREGAVVEVLVAAAGG